MKRKQSTEERGGGLLFVVLILFVVVVFGVTLLADYAIKAGQRQGSTSAVNEYVYRAIADYPDQGLFGYLGDVGDFPTQLSDLLSKPLSNPAGWSGPQ